MQTNELGDVPCEDVLRSFPQVGGLQPHQGDRVGGAVDIDYVG